MDEESMSTEEKIINAAIACVERYGLQGATTRRIAAMAGVNGAAINYYFRSKDALIEKCMHRTLDNAFDWEDFARLPGDTPQQRTAAIFEDLITGACNFPGITRAHYYELMTEGNYDSLVTEKFTAFLERLTADLKARGVGLEGEELKLAVAQVTAATMLMSLIPRFFVDFMGLDMHDPNARQQFVQRVVDRLLA
jgi:AcrR family transcriptional regulator